MMEDLIVTCNSIEGKVSFSFKDKLVATITKVDLVVDEMSPDIMQSLFVVDYKVMSHRYAAGTYHVTDLAMPTLISMIAMDLCSILSEDEKAIKTSYFASDNQDILGPIFISNNSEDDSVSDIIDSQYRFMELWNQYSEFEYVNAEIILLFQKEDFLADFACLLNVEMGKSISFGE